MQWYNENNQHAVEWLRNLIARGHLANGVVESKSIVDVRAFDIPIGDSCHFFAGIGGWPLALDLAGWPSDREVWTGSCPCQPFSGAGQGRGGRRRASPVARVVQAHWQASPSHDPWRTN